MGWRPGAGSAQDRDVYDELARRWTSRTSWLALFGIPHHFAATAWAMRSCRPGSWPRRLLALLLVKDAADAVAHRTVGASRALAASYAIDTTAFAAMFTLARPGDIPADQGFGLLGMGALWRSIMLEPEHPALSSIPYPLGLQLVELGTRGPENGGWRGFLVREESTLSLFVMLIDSTRRAFLDSALAEAERARTEGELRSRETALDARHEAGEESFVWLHRNVLGGLAEIRLGAELADDVSEAQRAQAIALVDECEQELREALYQLTIGTRDVPLAAVVSRLITRRRLLGRGTNWDGSSSAVGTMLTSDRAQALDRRLSEVLEHETNDITLALAADGSVLEVRTSRAAEMVPL